MQLQGRKKLPGWISPLTLMQNLNNHGYIPFFNIPGICPGHYWQKCFYMNTNWAKKKLKSIFFLWALISPILESLLPIVWFEVLKCYFRYSNTQTQSQKFKTCTLIKNVVHTNRVYFCELNKKVYFLQTTSNTKNTFSQQMKFAQICLL